VRRFAIDLRSITKSGGLDERDSDRATGCGPIGRTEKRSMQGPQSDASTLRRGVARDGSTGGVGAEAACLVVPALGGASRCGGLQAAPRVERRSLVVCRCLEWPQAVSGFLISAATFSPAVPDRGCFVRCSRSDSLEASSTGPAADVEGWRSIATTNDLKLRAPIQSVKHDVRRAWVGSERRLSS